MSKIDTLYIDMATTTIVKKGSADGYPNPYYITPDYKPLPCYNVKSIPYTQHGKSKVNAIPTAQQCRFDLEYPFGTISSSDCNPCKPPQTITSNVKVPTPSLANISNKTETTFSTITNQSVSQLRLYNFNYWYSSLPPRGTTTDKEDIINEMIDEFNDIGVLVEIDNSTIPPTETLVEDRRTKAIDPNSSTLWYQKRGLVSNLPASTPYTQHAKSTSQTQPNAYPREAGNTTPYPYPASNSACRGCGTCEDCRNCDNEGACCNNRNDCDYSPYPQPTNIKCCYPDIRSLPYGQHNPPKPRLNSFGAIRNNDYIGLLNYSISLINSYTNYYEHLIKWRTGINKLDITSTSLVTFDIPSDYVTGRIIVISGNNTQSPLNDIIINFPSDITLPCHFLLTNSVQFQITVSNQTNYPSGNSRNLQLQLDGNQFGSVGPNQSVILNVYVYNSGNNISYTVLS